MMDKIMVVVFEVATIIGACIGGFLIVTAIMPGYSAPQTAAQAAVGIGFVVVPYCLASIAHRAIIRKKLTPPS